MSYRKSSKHKRQNRAQVVGFYKDHGKTKPITKPVAMLNREKIVTSPKKFRGVNPQQAAAEKPAVAQVRDVSQELEDVLGELVMLRNNVLVFEEQRKQLLDQGSETVPIDLEIERTKQRAALLKDRIRKLGS
jgi:hypothetical protein